jgi:hypothetical protein
MRPFWTSQGWRTFVHNHADAIASIDMFVMPTISFGLLYGLLILRQSRRELLWLGVTAHPNAEWLARQLTEACGWDEPPRYLIRDRDGAYGAAFIRRIRAMGIRDRPVSVRRKCLDHVVVVGERHLRHVLATTRSERTYRCRRTRRFGVMCAEQGACVRRRSWAGYTINMFEFEFPTGTRCDTTRDDADHYGTSFPSLFRRAAEFSDKILRGANPAALRRGLAERGWIEGRTIDVAVQWASGDPLETSAKELVGAKPDVLLSRSTPTTAALNNERGFIPLVFVNVAEPVEQGLVQSLLQRGEKHHCLHQFGGLGRQQNAAVA